MYRKQIRRRRTILVALIVTSLVLLSAHFSEAGVGAAPRDPAQGRGRALTARVGRERGAEARPRPRQLVRRDLRGPRGERRAQGGPGGRASAARGGAGYGRRRTAVPGPARASTRTRWRASIPPYQPVHGADHRPLAERDQRDGGRRSRLRGRGGGGRPGGFRRRPGGPDHRGDRLVLAGAADHRPAQRRIRPGAARWAAGHRRARRRGPRRSPLDFVSNEQQVEEGQMLVTAGWSNGEISSAYPYGIRIGEITETRWARRSSSGSRWSPSPTCVSSSTSRS